jgi:glycosyltransferase involved in cell wall biosynthesis
VNNPQVSVICLCYNHELFVEKAIRSIQNQGYPHVQLIVVDDNSTDKSREVISKALSGSLKAQFIALPQNLGNCKAFNMGLAAATGDFIIDHSGDDVLMLDRIEKGINAFNQAGDKVGVNFTDAQLIDEAGKNLGYHSDKFPHDSIPQGNIYSEVLSRYFINSPSMMIRREVFEKLGGYDESLAYEDFDFWVRSSRYFDYCYTPEPLVKRRIHYFSMGKRQYKRGSRQLQSTLKVCEKALVLNTNEGENEALKKRIHYELRQALKLGEVRLAMGYWSLLRRV